MPGSTLCCPLSYVRCRGTLHPSFMGKDNTYPFFQSAMIKFVLSLTLGRRIRNSKHTWYPIPLPSLRVQGGGNRVKIGTFQKSRRVPLSLIKLHCVNNFQRDNIHLGSLLLSFCNLSCPPLVAISTSQRYERTKHQLQWTSLKKNEREEWRFYFYWIIRRRRALFVNTALSFTDESLWVTTAMAAQTVREMDREAARFIKHSLHWSTDERRWWWWWPGHSHPASNPRIHTEVHERAQTHKYFLHQPIPVSLKWYFICCWLLDLMTMARLSLQKESEPLVWWVEAEHIDSSNNK